MSSETLSTILFLVIVAITIAITFWASRNTKSAADYYAGRPLIQRVPERPGHLR